MSEEMKPNNLIYIAQERAFAPGISKGWKKIIQPSWLKHGRLVGVNVSDELMRLIEKELSNVQKP